MGSTTDTVAVTYELERLVYRFAMDGRLARAARQVRRAADLRAARELAEAREWLARAALTLRDYEGLRTPKARVSAYRPGYLG